MFVPSRAWENDFVVGFDDLCKVSRRDKAIAAFAIGQNDTVGRLVELDALYHKIAIICKHEFPMGHSHACWTLVLKCSGMFEARQLTFDGQCSIDVDVEVAALPHSADNLVCAWKAHSHVNMVPVHFRQSLLSYNGKYEVNLCKAHTTISSSFVVAPINGDTYR